MTKRLRLDWTASLGAEIVAVSYTEGGREAIFVYRKAPQAESAEEEPLQELEELLAKSRAHETFKADVRAFCAQGQAPRIRIESYLPRVKVQRLLKHILATEPDLPIQGIEVSGVAGCSDFVGTVEAKTHAATHVFEFGWCCKWKAEQEGWTDYFGFPDQVRAAQEFDWRCFHTWKRVAT